MDLQIVELVPEADMLPLRAARAIREADTVILQSERAECAGQIREWNQSIVTLDDLFETAEDFDALYTAGAQRIAQAAGGKAVFCLLGDAGTNGFIQELLRLEIEPDYISCGSAAAAALTAAHGIFSFDEYSVFSARDLEGAIFDTTGALVITGVDNAYSAEGVKCALAEYYAEDTEGLLYAGGSSAPVNLYDLDRNVELGTGGILCCPRTFL